MLKSNQLKHEITQTMSTAVLHKFRALGGKVTETGRSVTIEFPSAAAAQEFKQFAIATDNAVFE